VPGIGFLYLELRMTTGQRGKHTSSRPGRRAAAVIALAIALALAAPGMALAVFSSTPAAQTASVTAATIAPPTGFTVANASSTSALLTWTAPAQLTGYTLTSPTATIGTGFGTCTASMTSTTTTCTVTGLTANTAYTFTLTAVYNSWSSTSVTAGTYISLGPIPGTTSCVLGTLLCTGSASVTAASGGNELVFVYFASTLLGASVTGLSTGSGSPFSAATVLDSQAFASGTDGLYVFTATGNGTSNPVGVKFSSGLTLLPTVWVDVVQLGTGQSALSCSGCSATGTNGTATVPLTVAHSYDSEIAFVGVGATLGPSISSVASGFYTVAGGAGSAYGTFGATAQSTASFPVSGVLLSWGSIAVELQG
jgi:hypothetical protein